VLTYAHNRPGDCIVAGWWRSTAQWDGVTSTNERRLWLHNKTRPIFRCSSCSSSCCCCSQAYTSANNTHPFNGPLSRTIQVSRYQKSKPNLDFTEARDSEWQWHQLGHMQVCTSLQTENHASNPPLSFYRPDALPAAQPTASKHWRQNTAANNWLLIGLQAEQTIAIHNRKFLNKFSAINSALCQVFVVNAKKELESCCTVVLPFSQVSS